jgi:hypothetical protein
MYLHFFKHLCLLCLTYYPSLFSLLSVPSASNLLLSCSHKNRFAENGLCSILSSVLLISPVSIHPLFYLYYYSFLVSNNPLAVHLACRFLFLFPFSVSFWVFFLFFFLVCFGSPLLFPFSHGSSSVGLRRKCFQYQEIPGECPGTEIIFYTRFV